MSVIDSPGLPSSAGHSSGSSGSGSSGSGSSGFGSNGHGANGHGANGHGTNGHGSPASSRPSSTPPASRETVSADAVGVVVIGRNEGQRLQRCLRSLLSQGAGPIGAVIDALVNGLVLPAAINAHQAPRQMIVNRRA